MQMFSDCRNLFLLGNSTTEHPCFTQAFTARGLLCHSELNNRNKLLGPANTPFRIDGLITVVPAVAWKQPCTGLVRQAAPVLAQFLQQFWAEHHISVNASLAALNVNHHPLAVDVADFQVCQLGVPHSGGVERQQQNAMVGSESSIDELRDFFLAQDRRKVKWSFRIGSLGDAPGSLHG